MKYPDPGRNLSRNVTLLQFLWGCSYGCYLFVYGVWLVEHLGNAKWTNGLIGAGTPGIDQVKNGMIQAGILLAIRQTLNACLDIPLGLLADRFGRLTLVRVAFAAKLLFHLSLASLAVVPPGYPSLVAGVVASILFPIAYTSFSGAFSAWVVTEARQARVSDFAIILARGHNAFFLGELFAGVASPLLFQWKGPACFLLGAGFCAVAWLWAMRNCREHPRASGPDRLESDKTLTLISKVKERIQVLRKTLDTSQIALSVMTVYGCFMFLLNIVEYFWPVFVNQYIKENKSTQWFVWPLVVLLVCSVRLTGAALFKRKLATTNSISTEAKLPQIKASFLSCGLLSAAIAVTGHMFSDFTTGLIRVIIVVVSVLFFVFIHGLVAPIYDVLVNAVLPQELDPYRAAVLSIGTTIRSVLAIIFAVPAAASGWEVPGVLLLIATICSSFFMRPQRSPDRSGAGAETTNPWNRGNAL